MNEKSAVADTMEHDHAQTHEGKHALSLSFFGFGFYWAWLWILAVSPVPGALAASRTDRELLAVALVSAGVTAVVLALGALLAQQLSSPAGHRILIVGACAFGLASTTLMTFYRSDSALDWPGFISSSMIGISRACFILLWSKFYSSISMKRAGIYMSGSVALGALLYLAITSMQPTEAIICTLLLPIAAAVTFVFAMKEPRYQRDSPAESPSSVSSCAPADTAQPARPAQTHTHTHTLWPRFWQLFLGIGIYAVAFGFLKDTLFSPSNEHAVTAFRLALLGVAIVGLLLSAFAIKVPRLGNLVFIYRLILPITAIGFLLIPLLGIDEGSIAFVFVMAGFTIFDILTWLVLANISTRLHLSSYRVFGVGRSVHFSGLFIGTAIVRFTSGSESAFSLPLAPLSLVMVLMLIVASTLVLTEHEVFGKGLLSFDESKDAFDQAAESGTEQNRARFRIRCEAIAKAHDLSPREGEILALLARGRDTIFIQNELGISNHTVRSHVYHVYQKLDIHSRQELLDLIERRDEE
jgi:DNA-binding CsgD family transcriptional regulator/MFS family permease